MAWRQQKQLKELKSNFRNHHMQRIHGAAIYGDMDPINIPPLC